MAINIKSTPKKLFQLAQSLPPAEIRWLRDALNQTVKRKIPSSSAETDARRILQETFGMWADRSDFFSDGVAYVNQIRRSTRWDDLGLAADETD